MRISETLIKFIRAFCVLMPLVMAGMLLSCSPTEKPSKALNRSDAVYFIGRSNYGVESYIPKVDINLTPNQHRRIRNILTRIVESPRRLDAKRKEYGYYDEGPSPNDFFFIEKLYMGRRSVVLLFYGDGVLYDDYKYVGENPNRELVKIIEPLKCKRGASPGK
ncbi:MAG: hypothetical protein H7A51_18435 [Akkermansiaceae bacterium]|nr:hypothetical protein [Akkermansiaceae bacterium]